MFWNIMFSWVYTQGFDVLKGLSETCFTAILISHLSNGLTFCYAYVLICH